MKDKKEKILSASIQLFAKDGIGVPTAKIAKEAGVSNGTLFNHFETKQGLIEALYLHIKAHMAETVLFRLQGTQSSKETSRQIWRGFVSWALKNPLMHRVLGLLQSSQLLSVDIIEAGEDLFEVAFNAIKDGIEEGTIINVSVAHICEIAGGQLNATVSYIQKNKLKAQAREGAVEESFDIYWNGIKAR